MIFIIYFVAKYQKNERGPFETKKNKNKSHSAKKIEMGLFSLEIDGAI